MMLTENREILSERFPVLWGILKDYQPGSGENRIIVEKGRKGLPTLVVEKDEKKNYLHSKYDPVQEAEGFVEQLDGVEDYQHVFFYGVGLGYHIEAFAQKYPDQKITLYEPSIEVFLRLLKNRSLKKFPLKKINHIYVETSPASLDILLKDFADFVDEKVLFVSLPSYERVFSERFKIFSEAFKEVLKSKQTSLNVNYAFEKRWVLNSLINFNQVVNTPNIMSLKKEFQGKPVILVSAGPSLGEDLEWIRQVKERGLAFIFTVGSAVNVLVNNNIVPDAAFAHDPSHLSYSVFEGIINENQDNFPLVFGSSLAFEVVQKFRGPKLHMIISQDTFGQYCLDYMDNTQLELINDAPTIAIVTLELLYKLGCSTIILSGQNLAFKGDYFYSKDIKFKSSMVTDEIRQDSFEVESVDGLPVLTNRMFNSFRLQMEANIAKFNGAEVINTTKGGAKIVGAPFIPIEQLIQERLIKPVVNPNWYREQAVQYDGFYMLKQYERLAAAEKELERVFDRMPALFEKWEKLIRNRNQSQLELEIEKFNREWQQILKNDFYLVFLKQMERVRIEMLAKKIDGIKFESDAIKKAQKVAKSFGELFGFFKGDIELVRPVFNILETVIKSYNSSDDSTKRSKATEAIQRVIAAFETEEQ